MNAKKEVSIRSEEPDLIPKVIEFIQSATYDEKRVLLQKYPELLGQEADNILEQVEQIWKSRGDEAARSSIHNWREFLQRVAASDFEFAVLESVVYRAFVDIPLDSTFNNYLARLTDLHPELLSERADEAVRSVEARLNAKDGDDSVLALVFGAMRKAIQEQRNKQEVLRQTRDKMQKQTKKKWSVSDILN